MFLHPYGLPHSPIANKKPTPDRRGCFYAVIAVNVSWVRAPDQRGSQGCWLRSGSSEVWRFGRWMALELALTLSISQE